MSFIFLWLFLNLFLPNGVEAMPYYYNSHNLQQQKPFLPGTRFNMGIDPWSGSPERGNIGFGNNLAAFFYVCHTCSRGR
ncbi:hypothetical protein niasHT_015418 [Heterodera trifolii]|uniref:Uncharacterized protein n=1 Tax=Heterodera trifolii TaxID=157864 RepID=A0ABD2KZZ4_9BILA